MKSGRNGGTYDTAKDDRNLVHSLEHGYVIMSYNCDIKSTGFSLLNSVFAQEGANQIMVATGSAESSNSAALSSEYQSDQCKQLISQLTEVYNAKGQTRLVVVPRPQNDSRIILTSWRYMEKI